MPKATNIDKGITRTQKGVYLHPAIIERVKEEATRQNRSFGNMVEIALAQHFEIDLTKPFSNNITANV